jgi:hypothetical protein
MKAPHSKILLAVVILLLSLAAVLAAFTIQRSQVASQSGSMKTHVTEAHVDPDLQGRLQRFEERLEAIRREQHVQGLSVAVVKGREVVYLQGLGSAADGGSATPDTAYTVPSLNRLPGQTWTVRHLADLDVLLAHGASLESRPYLAWRSESSGGTPLQWSAVQDKDASLLYIKVPEKQLAVIVLASGGIGTGSVSEAFLKTLVG